MIRALAEGEVIKEGDIWFEQSGVKVVNLCVGDKFDLHSHFPTFRPVTVPSFEDVCDMLTCESCKENPAIFSCYQCVHKATLKLMIGETK